MQKFCWVVTLLFSCGAMLQMIDVMISSGLSAPQQAAGAAIACGLAIVPYVFTRAIEGLMRPGGSTSS